MEDLTGIGKLAEVVADLAKSTAGSALKPWQIKRITKAEIEAAKMKAVAEVEIDGLVGRAKAQQIAENIQQTANLENIYYEAIQDLSEEDEVSKPDDDFLDYFKAYAKIVSDEELQTLWGRILAGEMLQKGSYSKRTIDFVSKLDKIDAKHIEQFFTTLLAFKDEYFFPCRIGDINRIQDIMPEFMNSTEYARLEELGIFRTDLVKSRSITIENALKIGAVAADYFNSILVTVSVRNEVVEPPRGKFDFEFDVLLTTLGSEIKNVIDPKSNSEIAAKLWELKAGELRKTHPEFVFEVKAMTLKSEHVQEASKHSALFSANDQNVKFSSKPEW